jgi:hypothetical protein
MEVHIDDVQILLKFHDEFNRMMIMRGTTEAAKLKIWDL